MKAISSILCKRQSICLVKVLKRLKTSSNSIDFPLWMKSSLLFEHKELPWHYQVETGKTDNQYDRPVTATNVTKQW
jgi:hypothetical protein